jgi:hypothetical protein
MVILTLSSKKFLPILVLFFLLVCPSLFGVFGKFGVDTPSQDCDFVTVEKLLLILTCQNRTLLTNSK